MRSGQNEAAYRATLNEYFIPQSTNGKTSFRFWECLDYLAREMPTLFGQSLSLKNHWTMEPALYNLMEDVTDTLTANNTNNNNNNTNPNNSIAYDDNSRDEEFGAAVETVQQNLVCPIGVKKAKKRILEEAQEKKKQTKTRKVTASGSVSSMDTCSIVVESKPHPVTAFTEAIKCFQKSQDSQAKGVMCLELAKLGLALNQREKAVKYFSKAEELYDENKTNPLVEQTVDAKETAADMDTTTTVSTSEKTSSQASISSGSTDSFLLRH